MTENVINYLKKLFLWSVVLNKQLVYDKIAQHLPVNVKVINDSRIILDFGEFNDAKITILLEFKWENNKLVDIVNVN